jgi:hypothetical protein
VIVEIDLRDGRAATRLLEPDVFTAFKVVLRNDGSAPVDRLAAAGVARFEEHAWVEIDALRRLAGAAATPAWEESLQGMLAYARSKGWVDDDLAAVRAHVERAADGPAGAV